MKDNQLSNILSQYDAQEQVDGQLYTLNLGPTHPATTRNFPKCVNYGWRKNSSFWNKTIGYIQELLKIAERRNFTQITTLTDRLKLLFCTYQ